MSFFSSCSECCLYGICHNFSIRYNNTSVIKLSNSVINFNIYIYISILISSSSIGQGRGAHIGFQDVGFLLSVATPHLFKMAVKLKVMGQPHILELWLVVGISILSVKYVYYSHIS